MVAAAVDDAGHGFDPEVTVEIGHQHNLSLRCLSYK
jgi:hypothetical protein